MLFKKFQSIVEYGLLAIIILIASSSLKDVYVSTKQLIKDNISREISYNPKTIKTPPKPNSDVIYNNKNKDAFNGTSHIPTAFFVAPNEIYVGDNFVLKDLSFDIDGLQDIEKWEITGFPGNCSLNATNRVCTGKFNSKGNYEITLTVTDKAKTTNTFKKTITVKDRGEYCVVGTDNDNESRTLTKEGTPTLVGNKETKIIDHIFGYHEDLYGVKHIVIQKNIYQYIQKREVTNQYTVTIPIVKKCYNGNQLVSVEPYIDPATNSSYITKTENKTIPAQAIITTEVKDNTWTYYVYNEKNSYENAGNTPYKTYYADKKNNDTEWNKEVTQTPTFESLRKTNYIKNGTNTGYDVSQCKYCTIPNSYTLKSDYQTDTTTLTCTVDGYKTSSYVTYKSRYYNYIEHKAYDTVYKYTGTGSNLPSKTAYSSILQERASWITDGWDSNQMKGTGTPQTARLKYTSCTYPASGSNSGSSNNEGCWYLHSNTVSDTFSCEDYGTEQKSSYSCSKSCSRKVKSISINNKGQKVCTLKTETYTVTGKTPYTYYKQHKKNISCTFVGTTLQSSSGSWTDCNDRVTWTGECDATCNLKDETCP